MKMKIPNLRYYCYSLRIEKYDMPYSLIFWSTQYPSFDDCLKFLPSGIIMRNSNCYFVVLTQIGYTFNYLHGLHHVA